MVKPAPSVPARAVAACVALAAACAAGVATAAPDTALDEQLRALVMPLVALPPAARERARIELEVGQIDPRLKLAPCRRIEPRWSPTARAWGRTHVALRCVEGDRPWQVYLPLTVRVFAPALVAARPLPAGSVLAAEDLRAAEVEWTALARPPFTAQADAIGRTLGRALQAGQGVSGDDLKLRQWFASGELVQVVARGSGFAVSGEAQALGPGIEGQPVRVRTESGRVLAGTAVGERRVEVQL
ncbi:MAG: flagellar basal body P-ring formation chaperone FlgA [Rubrivivax sp.]